MASKQNTQPYKKKTNRKKTRQGAGLGTKYGKSKKSIAKYRGQGGRKSIKRS